MSTQHQRMALFALAWLYAAATRGDDVAEKAAEQDGRLQQYVQMLQPAMWKELDFIRQVCDLKPEQRPKIKAAGEAATKQAAKNMINPPAAARGKRPAAQATASQTIRDELAQALKETLPADEFSRYEGESTKRVAARKQATLLFIVGQMDGVLYLNKDQREKIMAALDTNWQPDWEQWLMVRQFGGEYFPMVPDQHVVPQLSPEQVSNWRGLQKINFSSWGNQHGRLPDDGWWEGKPENAAKAKTKGKAKAAKAAP